MRTKQQLVMDRPSALTDRPSALTARSIGSPNTTVKTILLHVQDDKALDMRLENALSIARACSAHVECLHVTPIEAYVAFDSFGGVFVMNDLMKALDEQETNLRLKIEAKLGKEDVSWNYVPITGNVASQLISHAALSDLVVTTREPHRRDFVGPTIGFLGDLLQSLANAATHPVRRRFALRSDRRRANRVGWRLRGCQRSPFIVGPDQARVVRSHSSDHGPREAGDVPKHAAA